VALLLACFVAGVLTVASPCVLPLLPVIVGGSVVRSDSDGAIADRQWYRPIVIAAGLAASVVLFSLLLIATTALLGVPRFVWQLVAGGIVIAFGVTLLFPRLWDAVMAATTMQRRANQALDRSYRRGGLIGDLLLGAALGPTFSSCSPTYALVMASVLPASFGAGVLYVAVYAVGLAVTLLLVGFLGATFARRLGWLARPDGWFRRVIGVLFIIVGLAVIFGLDHQLQALLLQNGWYDAFARFEESLTGRG
jgi:cytochrome c biogenesis protein CcdA